jgi:hypothetical protein
MPALIIKTTHEQYPELMKREIGEASRASNRAMAEMWVGAEGGFSMLADHFTPTAHYRYGYAQRSRRYLSLKMKAAASGRPMNGFPVVDGGRTDLVLSGRLRHMMTAIHPLIKAFPTRATVLLFGPPYFTDRPRDPRRPNMGREVTTVLAYQERALAGRADQAFNEKAQQIRATKTVIIR